MKTISPSHQHARELIRAGYLVVAGVDEVGRGCLAGPVVAAAVIVPPRGRLDGVTDSKLLSAARRIELARLIKRRALAVGVGWVAAQDIDEHGLSWAVRQSGLRALADMHHAFDAVLLDGKHNYLEGHYPSRVIVKGDLLSYSIAAASIIAKVARDNYMQQLHAADPRYGFDRHVGYGTAAHLAALAAHGPSAQHRRSFAPVAAQLEGVA